MWWTLRNTTAEAAGPTGENNDHVFDTSGWASGKSGTLNVAITSTFTDGRTLASGSITILVRDPNGDEDGDGLLSAWENTRIDGNGDAVVDLTLPGANVLHKDLYIEVDWMDCSNNVCDVSGSDRPPRPRRLASWTHSLRRSQPHPSQTQMARERAASAYPRVIKADFFTTVLGSERGLRLPD